MIDRFQKGDRLTASQLNQLVDAANRRIIGDGYITAHRGPGGLALGLNLPAITRKLVRPTRDETPPYVTFACLVWSEAGGSVGDKTTKCSKTYTARTLEATSSSAGGEALGDTLSPLKERPSVGKLAVAATAGTGMVGLGYFDMGGAFALYDANETLAPEACA